MAWETPNQRRHRATQEAVRGIAARLCDLETAPVPALNLDPLRRELTDQWDSHRVLQTQVEALADAVEGITGKLKDYAFALSEGIERTDRAERRIKATVARARKSLQERGLEDPNLESEAFALRERDGAGSEEDGVLAMHPQVAEDEPQASSIRGVSLDTLRRARGW